MTNLIIFGPPGSGKGTQSKKIAHKYDLFHISTGDIFRKEIKNKTKLGLKVKSIIDEGKLVPDDLVMKVLEKAFDSCKKSKGAVFDGFPRTNQQARELDKLLSSKNQKINIVISLEVSEDELLKRLVNRSKEMDRTDDTVEIIQNRLKVYRDQTQPLIEYYKEKGLFKAINGIGEVDEIFERICREIEKVI
mgnify:CR=1 FL=1